MRVTKVEHLSDYKLKLTFSDKKIKTVDLEEKIKNATGIFAPLKDLDYFKLVTLDDCHLSVCWPNGADICPDVLYNMGKTASVKKQTKKRVTKKNKISTSRRKGSISSK